MKRQLSPFPPIHRLPVPSSTWKFIERHDTLEKGRESKEKNSCSVKSGLHCFLLRRYDLVFFDVDGVVAGEAGDSVGGKVDAVWF